MAYQWDVAVGEHLTRKERMQRFGGGSQGGMEPSEKSPNVFLYSDPSRGETYGYSFDGWAPDGSVFLYTGEGPRGDQLMRDGNRALLEHRIKGRAVRLFVANGLVPGTGTKNHLYVGEFELDDSHPFTVEDALDQDGELRTVFVFRLLPVGPSVHRPEDNSTHEIDTTSGAAALVDLETDNATTFETPGTPPTTATKREAELVKRYTAILKAQDHSVRRWRLRPPGELASMHTDIYDEADEELYEAKGSTNRPTIRLALGQLLDYARHLPRPAKKLTVLLPHPPAQDLIALLRTYGVGCIWETPEGMFERHDPRK